MYVFLCMYIHIYIYQHIYVGMRWQSASCMFHLGSVKEKQIMFATAVNQEHRGRLGEEWVSEWQNEGGWKAKNSLIIILLVEALPCHFAERSFSNNVIWSISPLLPFPIQIRHALWWMLFSVLYTFWTVKACTIKMNVIQCIMSTLK